MLWVSDGIFIIIVAQNERLNNSLISLLDCLSLNRPTKFLLKPQIKATTSYQSIHPLGVTLKFSQTNKTRQLSLVKLPINNN